MPDPNDPDLAVTAVFARAAAALAASGHRVTVTTADLSSPLSPWSLAWAEVDWAGAHRLLILRHVEPGWEAGTPWDDAPPAARLASLAQLGELISRVVAAARAGRDRGPGVVELIDRDVDAAIAILQGDPEGGP